MRLKSKSTIFVTLIVMVVIAGIIYIARATAETEKTVRIVNYGLSICTQDVPSSSCGPYEVNVRMPNGDTATYHVAGFSKRDNALYDELTSKLSTAKEQGYQVTLTIAHKSEITQVK